MPQELVRLTARLQIWPLAFRILVRWLLIDRMMQRVLLIGGILAILGIRRAEYGMRSSGGTSRVWLMNRSCFELVLSDREEAESVGRRVLAW